MSEKLQLKNKLIAIMKANTINDLINVYEMIINSIDNLSRDHIDKVNDFINDLGSIKESFNNKDQTDQFNNDLFMVDLLKNNILQLYTNRLTRKYTSLGFKDD